MHYSVQNKQKCWENALSHNAKECERKFLDPSLHPDLHPKIRGSILGWDPYPNQPTYKRDRYRRKHNPRGRRNKQHILLNGGGCGILFFRNYLSIRFDRGAQTTTERPLQQSRRNRGPFQRPVLWARRHLKSCEILTWCNDCSAGEQYEGSEQ